MSGERGTAIDNSQSLLDVAIEFGYISKQQSDEVRARQNELHLRGIDVPFGQILLERRMVTAQTLKQLVTELELRRKKTHTPSPLNPSSGSLKRYGQYQILEVLAESGRCRIFKARDPVMDRVLVLKVLPPNVAKDKQWYERFRREMSLAGKLNHPNIITAYGAGEIDGAPHMAMEYVPGRSLGERLEREGNFPEKTAWLMTREVAKALAYAAENDILHRDIKPENILCSDDGKVKLIDLGLSKSLADDTGLTAAGTTVGTPFYISPEQARGTKDIDCRSDIYSLGCTAYHMLTGSVPFMREALTEVMLAHTKAPRPDPRDVLPEISEGSAKLVMKMMAINPNERPESAQKLLGEIEALLGTLPEPEASIRPLTKVAPSDTSKVPQKAKGKEPLVKERSGFMRAYNRFVDWLSGLFS